MQIPLCENHISEYDWLLFIQGWRVSEACCKLLWQTLWHGGGTVHRCHGSVSTLGSGVTVRYDFGTT